MFKIGDRVQVVESYVVDEYNLQLDSVHTVKEISETTLNVNLGIDNQWWSPSRFVLVSSAVDPEHYAAAFNAWQDEYVSNPQAFESSYDTAMRHVSEKLNGEEPSYGVVAAQLFQEYLNKTLGGK